jgi:hypothetical protein
MQERTKHERSLDLTLDLTMSKPEKEKEIKDTKEALVSERGRERKRDIYKTTMKWSFTFR